MLRYRYCSLLKIVFLFLVNFGRGHNHCKENRCGRHGPPIRFPFYLIDGKANYSGYPPGFGLSCTHKHEIVLELNAVKFSVQHIDYQSQTIHINDPKNCLPRKLQNIYQSSNLPSNSNIPSKFGFDQMDQFYSFFDCSSVGYQTLRTTYLPEQNLPFCPIFVIGSNQDNGIVKMDLVSCTKLFDVVIKDLSGFNLVNEYWYGDDILRLGWSKPNCSMCESKGMNCEYKEGGINDEIECSPCPNRSLTSRALIAEEFLLCTGVIGPIVLVVLAIALFHIYKYFKAKGEDQARVENLLQDYRSQKPTRLTYADIKRITNGFMDKLGEGAHGAVFKGKLSDKFIVAVKMLSSTEGDGKEFINEVGTMGKIHHVNVVCLLGFCADGVHRAFVYDFFPNGSLQNFITPPDNKQIFLGWEKLEQIALGVAKGIEYLHQGCDQRILHFDINPHNVLLDNNFTPKISDFGLAKLCSKSRSIVSITAARGTLGYIAPEVFSRNFGDVSYKFDIYSYGMLLLEMVGGRTNIKKNEETFQVLYPEWIYNLLEGGGDIRIHVERDEDIKIAKKLAIVGLWCIQWHPTNRPSIGNVLQMLEGEGDNLRVPPNPFDSTSSTYTSSNIPARHMELELEVIDELE
ncbi:hypothetical protein L6164_037509 [Bauhinia variegata]|uniref:Uncharacterized protein n=1 Tax=Bauhinia variegata TaxID=167791 RepID=A0ACB9KK33_BAUVA|nr:hypothetical protein L6164_037509 [Bauhinia variegata]